MLGCSKHLSVVDINGASALVTGGASGLGAAAATALRDRGARVTVVDLAGGAPHGCDFEQADVTDGDAVAAAVERAAANGPLRVCVNCAGIAPAGRTIRGPGEPLALEAFDKAIRINLVGTFNAVRLAAAAIAAVDRDGGEIAGVIVNTASIAAWDGQIGQAAYAASKAGVAGMTLPIARDLAKFGIRVCAIAPGVFDTPMMASMSDEIRDSLSATVPLPSRMGRPEEFGRLVVDIVENDYLNGETIRLDGAVRMPPR